MNMNVNFKDKYMWQGFLLFLACLSGLLFPEFLTYLLFLGMGVGVISMGYSYLKQIGKAK